MDSIRAETASDEQLQEVIRYIQGGWPEHVTLACSSVREYFPVHDGLVVRGSRIVIPEKMRAEILERIHEHFCVVLGIASQITQKVENCMYCHEQSRAQNKEPLPDRPWKKIGIDLLEHDRDNFLVLADYYSRCLEILHMPTTTSAQVTVKLKAIFARYGILEEVVTDNRPHAFRVFARELDFKHTTSNPHNLQGKKRLKKKRNKILFMVLKKTKHE